MKVFFLLVLMFCCLKAFCQKDSSKNQNYSYVNLKKDDPKFLALMDTAQKYLPRFIDSLLKHRLDTNYMFVIKSDFVENDVHEHMWSKVDDYYKESFSGVFVDSAFQLKNIKTGDIVHVKTKYIEDWIILKYPGSKILGGFSELYLKEKKE